MKLSLKRMALGFVPFLVMASVASAQSRTWSVCGGNTFNTCASVVLNVLAGNKLEVRVQNLSGTNGTFANTVFTAVGFENLAVSAVLNTLKKGQNFTAGSTTMSGPSILPTNPGSWIVQNNAQNGGGVFVDMVGSVSQGSSVKDAIASDCATAGGLPGGSNNLWASYTNCGGGYTIANQNTNSGWVVFSFAVNAHTLTQADLNNASLFIKGQNGVNGQSTELLCGPGQCTPPTQVTPEPMTLALVGTGLVGLVAIRRRRKPRAGVES